MVSWVLGDLVFTGYCHSKEADTDHEPQPSIPLLHPLSLNHTCSLTAAFAVPSAVRPRFGLIFKTIGFSVFTL